MLLAKVRVLDVEPTSGAAIKPASSEFLALFLDHYFEDGLRMRVWANANENLYALDVRLHPVCIRHLVVYPSSSARHYKPVSQHLTQKPMHLSVFRKWSMYIWAYVCAANNPNKGEDQAGAVWLENLSEMPKFLPHLTSTSLLHWITYIKNCYASRATSFPSKSGFAILLSSPSPSSLQRNKYFPLNLNIDRLPH